MAAQQNTAPRLLRVWDIPTRLFHWSLVLCVATALITGYITPEWWMGLHLVAGYAIVALLAFRLAWAFFGPEYSRLVSMVGSARKLHIHLRGLIMLRPPHYMGHNPAGSVMIIALFAVLCVLVMTGLVMLGGEEKQGPLAAVVEYATSTTARRIHEFLAIVLMAMIATHIAGVLVEGRLLRIPLIRGMITGWLPVPADEAVPTPRAARPGYAAAALAVLVIPAAAVLLWLSSLPVPKLAVAEAANAVHVKECGACHEPYHASLLPSASWQAMMTGLGDHFGEDASLPAPAAAEITAYLVRNGAGAIDSEASNRFRTVSPGEPLRITATPYWSNTHRKIADAVFALPAVLGKAHCSACHSDALTGRFDDQSITMPTSTTQKASP